MHLLHIDSSILADGSASRRLSREVTDKFVAATPGALVTYRDLAAEPLPHLSGAAFAATRAPVVAPDPVLAADLAQGRAALSEFLAADTVVIGVAFYNFAIPSQLKAWLDRIIIAGTTFRHNADGGVEGLAGDKRVVLAVARGNFYGMGSPHQAFEHAVSHLRTAFGFIGVTRLDVVVAEGMGAGPEPRAAGIAQAEAQIAALAA